MLFMERTENSLPDELATQLQALGLRIRAARTRRKLRREDLARKAGLSRTAIEAVERGAPTTGIGTYMRALWAMGINAELDVLADPGLDRDGMALEFSVQTKRVGVARRVNNDF